MKHKWTLAVVGVVSTLLIGSACLEFRAEATPPAGLVLIARQTPQDGSLYLRGICAGVIIADGVVATAHHCFPAGADSRFTVIQNVNDLCADSNGNDKELAVSGVLLDDLEGDLTYLSVPGVSMAESSGEVPASDMLLEAWGWGGKSTAHRACQLRRVELRALSTDECAAQRLPQGIDASLFCAVPAKLDEFNTCSGDSGGPVLAQRADGTREIVGITSSGAGCGPRTVGFVAAIRK